VVKKEEMTPMKIEIPFLAAALVLNGTSLLARMAAQGVGQAVFSAIEYCINRRRRK